jgi:hypothetical protein
MANYWEVSFVIHVVVVEASCEDKVAVSGGFCFSDFVLKPLESGVLVVVIPTFAKLWCLFI